MSLEQLLEQVKANLPACNLEWDEFTLELCWDHCWRVNLSRSPSLPQYPATCYDTPQEALQGFIDWLPKGRTVDV